MEDLFKRLKNSLGYSEEGMFGLPEKPTGVYDDLSDLIYGLRRIHENVKGVCSKIKKYDCHETINDYLDEIEWEIDAIESEKKRIIEIIEKTEEIEKWGKEWKNLAIYLYTKSLNFVIELLPKSKEV